MVSIFQMEVSHFLIHVSCDWQCHCLGFKGGAKALLPRISLVSVLQCNIIERSESFTLARGERV